ncbi:MAG: hypothetical protein KIT33_11725 [Candidatus Kapabacteria bacterium]|nr:hypothetical protein [Ignavibacteriota bacterium]MCW5885629.1 hypothetical protein [Candidatus Kapabacteria bacterium]
MKKVDSLSSARGRLLLQEVYYELKYKKQLGSISILLNMWRICVYDTDLSKYVSVEINVLHRLGFLRGTKIWMEEVVNRFFFSTINSFVYFGAAVLLVLIGVRRFSEAMSDNLVIAGVIFEAALLFFMFIVMLFTPDEESPTFTYIDSEEDVQEELLTEIGEIARDFAQSAVQLENLTEEIAKMNINQEKLVDKLDKLASSFADASSPNPDMLEIMKQTNSELETFRYVVSELNKSVTTLKKEEVEFAVRKELEKIISNNVINS